MRKNQRKLLKKILFQIAIGPGRRKILWKSFEKKNEQAGSAKSIKKPSDPFLNEISKRLRSTLSTKVDVKPKGNGKGGEIRIEYYSNDDLERLMQIFDEMG